MRRIRMAAIVVGVAALTSALLPPALTASAATDPGDVTFQGKYVELHADGADGNGKNQTLQYLEVGDRHYRLHGSAPLRLRSGQPATVTGSLASNEPTGGDLNVKSALAAGPAPTLARVGGSISVLVILTQWAGNPADAVTQATAVTQVGTDDNAWYQAVSNGATSLTATATPWVTIAPPSASSTCDYDISSAAKSAAQAAGYDPSSYSRTMVYFPWWSPCGYGGLGEIGGGQTWVNGELDRRVTVHELGHNFGLYHAHSYRCLNVSSQQTPMSTSCTMDEYGDTFDAMGTGFSGVGHFNASQADLLGWLPGRVQTAASSGSYVLAPIETTGTVSTEALKVATSQRTYWLEYRQPTGVDDWLSGFAGATGGVIIHTPDTVNQGSLLLDMTPNSSGDFDDAALPVGSHWTDPTNAVQITVTAVDATGAHVTVSPPGSTATVSSVSPTKGDISGGTPVTINGSGFAGATAVHFGTVDAASFTVNGTGTQVTTTSPAQAAGVVDVTVTTPVNTSAAVAADHFTYAVIPQVSSLSPANGPTTAGRAVTITGTGFTGATAVHFGSGSATNLVVVDDSHITVNAPAGTAGTVDVTVTGPAGTSATGAADHYVYVTPAAVTSLSPTKGDIGGGTPVTIFGSGFTGATAVRFGSVAAASFTVNGTGTQITTTSPAHAAGVVDVTVTGPANQSAASTADVFTYVVIPQVSGLSPAMGSTGGGTPVTITGSGFTGATSVHFGFGTASSVVVVDDNHITVHSPAASPGTVDVTVTGPGGTSPASAADHYTFALPAAVTSVSPTKGDIGGGTPVTIFGSGFTGATAVHFGSVDAASFTVNATGTQITTTSPAQPAGVVDVTVTGPVNTSGAVVADHFTYAVIPQVSGVSPAMGSTSGGTAVTITGSGFTGATSVHFGFGSASSVVVVDDNHITVHSPAASPGTVDVTVTGPGGTSPASAADHYTFALPAVVSSLSPTKGDIGGGTPVTIFGSGFTGATAVHFGSVAAASFTVNATGTQITTTSPAQPASVVDVTVTTPVNTSAVATGDHFTYAVIPQVTGVSPATGPTTAGTPVGITGSGFTGATSVRFGFGTATNLVVVDDSHITVNAPAGTPGTVDVMVTGPAGTSPAVAADHYLYVIPAAVTSVSPSKGDISGGTPVTIFGSGFTGATAVHFGSVAAASFTVNATGTQITTTSPAQPASVVDITVTGPINTSGAVLADHFTYAVIPQVSSISPALGPNGGGTAVTINGSGFTGATAVRFGFGTATNLVVVNDNQITATSPAGSVGTVDVSVTGPGGTSPTSVADRYTYALGASVFSISPLKGDIGGGTTVTINGSGFTNASAVHFGTADAASFTVNATGTQITTTSPAHAAGLVDLTVTTPVNTSAVVAADRFTYAVLPVVSGVSPHLGTTVAGAPVTITGSGFTGATSVRFGFGSATGIVVVDDNHITVNAPAGTPGTVDVTVTGPAGTSATGAADHYTFAVVPTVISLAPRSGIVDGGTTVTVNGSGFIGASAVRFGTVDVTNFTVNQYGTQITVAAPAAATVGTVDVRVVTVAPSPATPGDVFTYVTTPTVTKVSPATASHTGGTAVVVTGSGFTGATQVTFGGIPGTGLIVVSDGEIHVTAPAAPIGPADVVVTGVHGPSAVSASDFLFFT